jgi:hypothetical protein
MSIQTSSYLKGRFEDGDSPVGKDFIDLIDSCLNSALTSLSAGNGEERVSLHSEGVSAVGNFYVTNDSEISGDISIQGSTNCIGTLSAHNVTLGHDSNDNITVNGRYVSDQLPTTDNTYDLGSSTHRYHSGYFGTLLEGCIIAYKQTLSKDLTLSIGTLNICMRELGIIDGITLNISDSAELIIQDI